MEKTKRQSGEKNNNLSNEKIRLNFQNTNDSQIPQENIQRNPGERYKEALQRFRTDRAEQQQREVVHAFLPSPPFHRILHLD